ncbi:hypothetical protein GTQ34_14580 [Muricauda sp. JGD-17]|uniref:CHAT domain-containing protein n=1 Tax=Flagellimonas ochracea TaxID=2696472 RepID=A0A964TDY8_9FLAO|nr:CHAT domain-containing protein [Allomuricauda ochracea]NAY93139.1 hypothetical protein [Allomuricauda ochracea]
MSYKILLFWSNPVDRESLKLVEEENLISDFIKKTGANEFEFDSRGGAKVEDFWDMVMEHEPKLVHISAHGTENNEVCFEDREGYEEKINIHDIIDYLNDIKSIECLILNSCYSSRNIDEDRIKFNYLIGMNKKIPDDTAHLFSNSFYNALLKKRGVRNAFKLALGRIKLSYREESKIPKLIEKEEIISNRAVDENQNEEKLISTEEIESLKNSVKQYWHPILIAFISILISLCCFMIIGSKSDSTAKIAGILVLAVGLIWSLLIFRKIQRTLQKIEVLEIKRNRYLKALGKLNQEDITELNNDFYKLM